ncbi:ribosomal protein S5 [Microbotryomycetes sp. JL221]|nr:ribosomal protein S5 [Microbotryomycetes sp. JL221]
MSLDFTPVPLDVVAANQNGLLLFNRWESADVEVKDISLTDYIQVRNAISLPHTAGRYAAKQFRKAQMPIVERLVNRNTLHGIRGADEDPTNDGQYDTTAALEVILMMNGRNSGKKQMAVRIVAHAFEIVHLLTDQNPVQVLVDAIVNTGPREDSTRIGSQGTVRRQAVDVSPLRRVNQAIALITIGTRESAFRSQRSVAECLADELINAAKGSSNSYAIKKKDELERVAKSNR